ncbi:peroxisomal coenzyme A diphosphatase NUDT7 [Megalops cyprinoides]|uniref:peroxisomal coenzyme A diphosphatase NUDT7 n=1 Tax=Megalops cyprinoides TaxID=118141 RepID=UPI0018649336|nr:peroxisomal coenzyme A diphosphatase NUDT7 [Megalops cyprinoides]
MMDDIKGKIKDNLKQHEIGSTFSYLPVLPKASVLIPLFVKKGEIHVLMTLRSLQLKSNAGEVCFPGGKYDPRDRDEIDTALREAEEEIGLTPDKVEVVCKLFPIINKSGLLVTPVVAFIEDLFEAQPNPAEVSDVFSVPLEYFLGQAGHSSYTVPGFSGKVHNFLYQDLQSGKVHQIWGLTAVLAIVVAALALRKKPSFETGFDTDNPLPHFQRNLNLRISKL